MCLDVGHSGTDFRFATARMLFDQGYLPTTISTDLNVFNVDHPVVSLAQTMSEDVGVGLPLADVIAMTTCNPARGDPPGGRAGNARARAGSRMSACCGSRAGEFELSDGFEAISVDERLVPVGCVRAGTWIEAA